MFTNPTGANQSSFLIEQFQRKGYHVQQVKQENATLTIFSHEKKSGAHNSEITARRRN
jgi:hypothetical protein